MIELDYGALLSPEPVVLSIGTILKPKLRDISKLTLLKLTPKLYYTELLRDEDGEQKWNSLDDETRDSLTLFDIIQKDAPLQQSYCDVLNFFFLEKVVYAEKAFILLRPDFNNPKDIDAKRDIHGVISTAETFQQVSNIIQQICCIYEKPKEKNEDIKFKNKLAKKIYEKMLKAQEERDLKKSKQVNKDYSLPNIISAVSNKHNSLNPINVWDLTIYQLIDSFNRLRTNAVYDINSLRISVWGDEKKQFDETLWYKYKEDNPDNNE